MAVDMIFRRPHVSVPLVLPTSLLERVNRLALERGINRSALTREAIQATYFDDQTAAERVPDPNSPSNMGGRDSRRRSDHGNVGGQ